MKHHLKDLGLILRTARDRGLEVSTLKGLRSALERAVQQGLGGWDDSPLREVIVPRPHE